MKQALHKNFYLVLFCTLLTNFIAGSVGAQSSNTVVQAPAPQSKIEKNAVEELEFEKEEEMLSKYFGAGIMANIDFGGGSKMRIKNAKVVAGKVRIEEESKAQVGFFLEAHKFIKGTPDGKSKTVNGPFVGLVMAGDAGIDSAILGWVWGFRQPKTSQTLNLGLGLAISPRAQILGDGLMANSPLPVGETEIRFKKTTKYGLAFSVSFGF